MEVPEWMIQGACRKHPELNWFVEGADVQGRVDAQRICDTCPVKALCLDWGLHYEAFGIWGGETETSRRRLRRQLHIFLFPPQAGMTNLWYEDQSQRTSHG